MGTFFSDQLLSGFFRAPPYQIILDIQDALPKKFVILHNNAQFFITIMLFKQKTAKRKYPSAVWRSVITNRSMTLRRHFTVGMPFRGWIVTSHAKTQYD